MIVMKFGGSSVADAERLRHVAEIVSAYRGKNPAVVLSAMGDTTDHLLEAGDIALKQGKVEIANVWKLHKQETKTNINILNMQEQDIDNINIHNMKIYKEDVDNVNVHKLNTQQDNINVMNIHNLNINKEDIDNINAHKLNMQIEDKQRRSRGREPQSVTALREALLEKLGEQEEIVVKMKEIAEEINFSLSWMQFSMKYLAEHNEFVFSRYAKGKERGMKVKKRSLS